MDEWEQAVAPDKGGMGRVGTRPVLTGLCVCICMCDGAQNKQCTSMSPGFSCPCVCIMFSMLCCDKYGLPGEVANLR